MIGNNKTVTVSRLAAVNGKKSYTTTVISGVPCYIERASIETVNSIGGVEGYKVYTCIFDSVVNLQSLDKVTDQNSVEYKVYSVEDFDDNIDTPSHTEAILRRKVT